VAQDFLMVRIEPFGNRWSKPSERWQLKNWGSLSG